MAWKWNSKIPLSSRGGRLTSLDASFMRCFGFFQTSSKTSRSMFFSKHRWNIASLSKKCDVLRDVLGFRWPGPTMLKMVRIFNINAYLIWYCWPCQYFCQQIIIKETHCYHTLSDLPDDQGWMLIYVGNRVRFHNWIYNFTLFQM